MSSAQGPRSCPQRVFRGWAGAEDFWDPGRCPSSAFRTPAISDTKLSNQVTGQLYEFPAAAVKNYHNLSSLKQHKFMVLQFWRSESEMGLMGIKSRSRQDCAPSGGGRENSSSSFPAPRGHLLSLAHDLITLMSSVT